MKLLKHGHQPFRGGTKFTSSSRVICNSSGGQQGKSSGTRERFGRVRYQTKRRKTREEKDLQDLLVDPLYDPLFADIDDGQDLSGDKDPFKAETSPRGRPRGSSTVKRGNRSKDGSAGTQGVSSIQHSGTEVSEDDKDPLVAYLTHKEQPPPRGAEILKKYERAWYLKQEQEAVMAIHHQNRATEISNYAQSTALAAIMEKLERADEYSDDPDPLPSWIRAKKLMAENWHVMEQLAGSRKNTLTALNEYAEVNAERQHLLDTWDPSIYEGERDSDDAVPAFIDRYLIPSAPRQTQDQSESSLMDELLPDMDFFGEEEDLM